MRNLYKQIFIFCLTFFVNSHLIAQSESFNNASSIVKTEAIKDFLNLILKQGGLLIFPLFFLSFLTIVLILYYFFSIRKGLVSNKEYITMSEKMIRDGEFLDLISFSSDKNLSIARICYKAIDFALKNPGAKYSDVKEVTESEASKQIGVLSNRVSYLADIGAIAPMVGLLGTVIGMIKAFGELSQTVGVLQSELSGGVAEALITTASGLVIGIVALIFYSFFRGKVQKLITEIEASTTHLLALISTQFNSDVEGVN